MWGVGDTLCVEGGIGRVHRLKESRYCYGEGAIVYGAWANGRRVSTKGARLVEIVIGCIGRIHGM
jgi:hypothetical protein